VDVSSGEGAAAGASAAARQPVAVDVSLTPGILLSNFQGS